ncbi:hypothetical protein CAPTEDRAFT_193807 [Capitella teleta]|uniref:CAP-Gly domain-containing protein n=1 Tax=Capitella teleta TaxID=283909 RepID=R7T6S1_CAPTE|nr:hypothetical protein CAPTEDRAFT_193807 [Capitella teleta]|eukprot:ELT89088.1 hypothetical protein CAPTEDRAFT_193807 [Capitella teleta]
MDPFHCGCSKCEVFWRKLTKNSEPGRLSLASSVRAEELNPLNSDRKKDPLMLKVGDHVLVKGRFKGVIQYVGVPERNLRANMYVGVKLENNCGYDTSGHRFIGCTQGHGTLVKYAEVAPLKQSSIKQKIYGNAMFPSYEHIVKARKLRAQRSTNPFAICN